MLGPLRGPRHGHSLTNGCTSGLAPRSRTAGVGREQPRERRGANAPEHAVGPAQAGTHLELFALLVCLCSGLTPCDKRTAS